LSEWSRDRVNIDYHIAFDTNYYSVPYNLVHELVEVRSTPTTIEIFHKSQRVASHLRAHGHGHAITIAEHRPRSHQAHLEWTPSRMVHWAQTIGPHTARLFERILADKPHPEMGYRSCLGIIRLADSVLTGSHGSRSGAGTSYGSVPLPERQVDPEELARCTSAHSPGYDIAAIAATSARQHPWRRVLRVRTWRC
jgi:transposase